MAKTIFKSSEKSNFILNMTEEQYGKIASVGLLTAFFTTALFTIVPTVTIKEDYSFSAAGLAVSGVICMILALIALVKKYVNGAVVLPAAAFGAMLLWGVVSAVDSYDLNVAIYGFPQRGEGMLALLFYFCFFITAASLKRKQALSTLVTGVIGIGLLNAVWSLIQIFFEKLTYSAYISVTVNHMSVAASGLCQSPIFLAMVLSLSLTAAVTDYVLSESKKRRVFDMICICLFSFVLIFTHCIVGIFGAAFGIIASIAAVVRNKAAKKRLASAGAVALSALTAVLLCSTVMKGKDDHYTLYDGYILWMDDAYLRVGASGKYNANQVDIESPADVYSFLNSKTLDIIKDYPLTGTGPEQLVYPQIYTLGGFPATAEVDQFVSTNAGTFDKVYNEYLYTAATRGIISLIALLVILFGVIAGAKKELKKERDPAKVTLTMVTICGIVVFLIGCSNITFSPIFWVCAGAACSASGAAAKKPSKAKKKAAK